MQNIKCTVNTKFLVNTNKYGIKTVPNVYCIPGIYGLAVCVLLTPLLHLITGIGPLNPPLGLRSLQIQLAECHYNVTALRQRFTTAPMWQSSPTGYGRATLLSRYGHNPPGCTAQRAWGAPMYAVLASPCCTHRTSMEPPRPVL